MTRKNLRPVALTLILAALIALSPAPAFAGGSFALTAPAATAAGAPALALVVRVLQPVLDALGLAPSGSREGAGEVPGTLVEKYGSSYDPNGLD